MGTAQQAPSLVTTARQLPNRDSVSEPLCLGGTHELTRWLGAIEPQTLIPEKSMLAAICRTLTLLLLGSCFAGCTTVLIVPGHRGLLYKPSAGGLQTQVLVPGRYSVGLFDRIDDFDVTYTNHTEEMQLVSSEGLQSRVRCSIIYRPIIAELYELASEIGGNYYLEIIGPTFRTAMREAFADHSFVELQQRHLRIEGEIRAAVQSRLFGKHVEIADVTVEEIKYAPEIADAIRKKLMREQESGRTGRDDGSSSCVCDQKSQAPMGIAPR